MRKAMDQILACAAAGILGLATANGQCVDWADGFVAEGLGCDGTILEMRTTEVDGQSVLFVGGSFSQIGGIAADSLARWDGSTWSEVGGGVSGEVHEIEFYDEGSGPVMFVGGNFQSVGGGLPIRMLARYAEGQWSEVGASALTNPVQAMAVHDGKLFVGGRFTQIEGRGTLRLAAWDGAAWQTYSSGPSNRDGHAMTYAGPNLRTMLFGGDELPNGTERQDTWKYDGQSWERIATTGPEPRVGHSMAYDSLRDRVLLFGGQPRGWGGGTDSRLWVWTNSRWWAITDYLPVHWEGVSIAYDQARDRVVWFGGVDLQNNAYDDTWEFDGDEWIDIIPATTRPPGRAGYGIAYDAARQQTVMFGGHSNADGLFGDTWTWDGVDWTLASSVGPSPRTRHYMVYDSAREMVVLYGGGGDPSGWKMDTWGWDGTQWLLLAPADPDRPYDSHGPMAYDPHSDRVVMRDERGVTWLWDGTAWEYTNEGGLNGEVFDLASFDDGTGADLCVSGYFTQAGAVPARRVARLTPEGWQSIGGGIQDGDCYSLYVWDDGGGEDLYIGGAFSQADNQTVRCIGRWDGSAWSLLNVGDPGDGGGVNGGIHAMFAYDDGTGEKLYVGGGFDRADGPGAGYNGDIEAFDIARWDGSVWEPVGGHIRAQGSNRGVFAMGGSSMDDQGRLFAGGDFDTAGGKPSSSLAVWGGACTPPSIFEQPEDALAIELEPVVFSTQAWGTRPLTFQWRKNGVNLADNGRITGATTERLMIDPWYSWDAGLYDVVVGNALGSVTSDPAELIVNCPGDFNGDGTVNSLDVLDFLNAWSTGDPSADINGDGAVDTLDVLAFLNLWRTGGC